MYFKQTVSACFYLPMCESAHSVETKSEVFRYLFESTFNLGRSLHSKATSIFNLLQRKLYGCSQLARHQSFCSLVLPILQYACQVWMPYYKKDITLIESVQKRASRWICGSGFNPCTYQWDPPSDACLAQLKWPYMTTRFTRLSLMFYTICYIRNFQSSSLIFFSLETHLLDLTV